MLNAERMLNKANTNRIVITAMGYPATLTQDIIVTRYDGSVICLGTGAEVFVDIAKGLACAGQDYFDIEEDQFKISFQN